MFLQVRVLYALLYNFFLLFTINKKKNNQGGVKKKEIFHISFFLIL